MDTHRYMVVKDGKDITKDISFYSYDAAAGKYTVAFESGKTYSYQPSSLVMFKDPAVLDPDSVYVEHRGRKLFNIHAIYVFRYLYRQYAQEREEFLKEHRHVSSYDSENLMYALICELLESHPNLPFGVVSHYPLYMLIRDMKYLDARQRRYAGNPATHVDFLIYSRVSKKPVLAIEVDGYEYHKEGSRQKQRDEMKDAILALYGIKLIRCRTDGSGEKERIEKELDTYEKEQDKGSKLVTNSKVNAV